MQPGQYSYYYVVDQVVTMNPNEPVEMGPAQEEVHKVQRGGAQEEVHKVQRGGGGGQTAIRKRFGDGEGLLLT